MPWHKAYACPNGTASTANFTPKLSLKLALMSLMGGNAILIGTYVIPTVTRSMGQPMSAMPKGQFFGATQAAAISMFFWTSGLMLGSSVVLKTASRPMLWPLALGWFLLASALGHGLIVLQQFRGSGPTIGVNQTAP